MEMEQDPTMDIPQSMRAWIYKKVGMPNSVLQLSHDRPIPSLSSDTSILVRVSHVALHLGTVFLMNFVPFLFRSSPSCAETDFSGVVVAVGPKVPQSPPDPESPHLQRYFPPGTAVFGSIAVAAHLQGHGALAEYLVVEMDAIARKPENLSFAEASGLAVSGATAITLIDAADIKPGDCVLVNACCGGVGHFATQLAREKVGETGTVVGICSSSSTQIAMQLGCNEVLDYHPAEDGTTLTDALTSTFGGQAAFDAILDAYGSQTLWHVSPAFLKSGVDHPYTSVGPALTSHTLAGMLSMIANMVTNTLLPVCAGGVNRVHKQVASFVNIEKLERIRELSNKGKLRTHVGAAWEFEDAIEAYEMLFSRKAKGKLVVRIWEPASNLSFTS
ncbi:chaperonin 10-like protein [Lipomyces doorenjongii]